MYEEINAGFTSDSQIIPIQVFPNPNNGNFYIKSDKMITVKLLNQLGQLVYVNNKISKEHHIEVDRLESGFYIAMIHDDVNYSSQHFIISINR